MVTLSPEAQRLVDEDAPEAPDGGDASELEDADEAELAEAVAAAEDQDGDDGGEADNGAPQLETEEEASPGELSDEDRVLVARLRSRDGEVRSHEAAHVAASGGLAGAPSFSYQIGPDGGRYAIGGSVSIDTSPGSSPEETLRRAQQVRAAALAPATPSGPDQAVAAAASQMASRARAELASQAQESAKAQASQVSSAGSPTAQPVGDAVGGTGGLSSMVAVRLLDADAPVLDRGRVLMEPSRSLRSSARTELHSPRAHLASAPSRVVESPARQVHSTATRLQTPATRAYGAVAELLSEATVMHTRQALA